MTLRTGIDLVHIPRFAKFLENPAAVKRTFSSKELERDSVEHLAGVFAIKEAFFKALGKSPDFLAVEVSPSRGKPSLLFSESFGILSYDVSVSHDADYCVASVVMMVEDNHE